MIYARGFLFAFSTTTDDALHGSRAVSFLRSRSHFSCVLAHSPNVFMVYAFLCVPFGVLLLLPLSFLVCAQRVFIIFM